MVVDLRSVEASPYIGAYDSEAGRRLAAVKALDADDRKSAALSLHYADDGQSDDEQTEIDEVWDDEIDQRMTEIHTSDVELVDSEETMRIIRVELAARRRS